MRSSSSYCKQPMPTPQNMSASRFNINRVYSYYSNGGHGWGFRKSMRVHTGAPLQAQCCENANTFLVPAMYAANFRMQASQSQK